MPEQHIISAFDSQLNELKNKLNSMENLVREQLLITKKWFENAKTKNYSDFVENDEDINQIQKDIDECAFEILLRFTPMATDLRTVVGSMQIARCLERIGDHTINIGKHSKKLFKKGNFDKLETIIDLFDKAFEEYNLSIQSYKEADMKLAYQIKPLDDKLDSSYKKTAKELYANITSDEYDPDEHYLEAILLLRHIERIGDLSKNMAESIIFIHSSEDIRYDS